MKIESGPKITKGFAALRTKPYTYLTDNKDKNKKTKDKKKCNVKTKLKFED